MNYRRVEKDVPVMSETMPTPGTKRSGAQFSLHIVGFAQIIQLRIERFGT